MVSTAPWSAPGPASARSCTCILKPAVLQSPSTGGAPNATTIASWTCRNCARRLAATAVAGRRSRTRSSNGARITNMPPAFEMLLLVRMEYPGRRIVCATPGVAHHLVEPRHHLLGPLEAGAVRQHRVHHEVALVLLRDEANRHGPEADPGEHHEPGVQGEKNPGHAHEPRDDAAVAVGQPLEDAIEPLEEGEQAAVHPLVQPIADESARADDGEPDRPQRRGAPVRLVAVPA